MYSLALFAEKYEKHPPFKNFAFVTGDPQTRPGISWNDSEKWAGLKTENSSNRRSWRTDKRYPRDT